MTSIATATSAALVAATGEAPGAVSIQGTPGGMLGPADEIAAGGLLNDITSIQKADIDARLLSTVSKTERDTLKSLIRNTA